MVDNQVEDTLHAPFVSSVDLVELLSTDESGFEE